MGVLCAVCMQANIHNLVTAACDVNTDTWMEVGDKVPPTIHFPQLVPCNGSLVLVTNVSKDKIRVAIVQARSNAMNVASSANGNIFGQRSHGRSMSYSLTDSHASMQKIKFSSTP